MTNQALVQRLKADALCSTSHPSDAVAALIEAAASILSMRFSDAEIVVHLSSAFTEALSQPGTAGPTGGQEQQ